MTPVEGTIVADRFRLVRLLGRGGMGDVWVAQHIGLDVPCAIKFIQSDARDSSEVRQRFEREARIAAQMRSPHVVQILDHGVWEATPYIAMEFLEGEDLDDRLRRQGKLSALETASITAQVTRALSKAHAAGLVHRDLKPANIFLARDDDREIVKVLDFGIAKDNAPRTDGNEHTTKTGAILGTPAYMSPEQAQGVKRVDHRSDLWSLAVVVYECLTGELPFQSEAFGDLLLKIMVHPLPVPSAYAPLPAGFDAWWARAASRDPDDRFQSAKEMSDALVVALGISGEVSGVRSRVADPFGGALSMPDGAAAMLPEPARPVAQAASLPAPSDSDSGQVRAAIGGWPADPAAPGMDRALRRSPPTAGPVSTSLPALPAPRRKDAARFFLAVLAGAVVAGVGALIALRSVSSGDTAPANASSAVAEAPLPDEPALTVTPAPMDAGEPAPLATADVVQAGAAATAAPAAAGAPSSAAARTTAAPKPTAAPARTTPASTAPPRPPPAGTMKKPGLNDFGI